MIPPGSEDKVMHTCLRIGDTMVMASDGRCEGAPSFQGFSLSLTVADEAEADRVFAALAEGGQIQMPLTKTFLVAPFRHALRPLRRRVDGQRRRSIVLKLRTSIKPLAGAVSRDADLRPEHDRRGLHRRP